MQRKESLVDRICMYDVDQISGWGKVAVSGDGRSGTIVDASVVVEDD
jgi:hypothetical protein